MRPPPIPCGSSLPECDEPCARPHSCTHPVNHNCHGELSCPPCTFLVDRHCYGMHEVRKNIPCHIDSVSCGRTCDKQLYCGVHKCIRKCHSGECLTEGDKCTRPCPVVRSLCEHPCALPCHSKDKCPESVCKYLVDITCECGRRKSQMKCFEFKKMMAKLMAVKTEDAVESGQLGNISGVTANKLIILFLSLSCDDDCKRAARNRKLAKALNIVTNEDGDTENELTITFSEYLKTEFKSFPQFVIDVEKVFLNLLENISELTNLSCSTVHNFRPMPMERRRFIHEYASYFNIETVSVDEAPKRSVIATVKRGISKAPLILLTSLHKYPGALSTPGPVTLRSNINEEIKHRAAVEISLEEGITMKPLKSDRWVHKRVAPQLKTVEPLKQSNVFDVLGSDNEESVIESGPTHTATTNNGWWSDEETFVDQNEGDRCTERYLLHIEGRKTDTISCLDVYNKQQNGSESP
uniref:R3H domain-containing protein n=1 Tax=Heterorhabditis bacteriophora TaxID=37862 RepID=A0A1I7XJW4_HETBA